ncbi:MAG: PIN domain-containing protein, partial [Saprospiraceae bacterium]
MKKELFHNYELLPLEYFINNLKEIKELKNNEIWFSIDGCSPRILSYLTKITEELKKIEFRLFIIISSTLQDNEDYLTLEENVNKNNNIYLLPSDKEIDFRCHLIREEKEWTYLPVRENLAWEERQVPAWFMEKRQIKQNDIDIIKIHYQELCRIYSDKIKTLDERLDEINPTIFYEKEGVQEIERNIHEFRPFDNVGSIAEIIRKGENIIKSIKEERKNYFLPTIEEIQSRIKSTKNLDVFYEVEKEFNAIKNKLLIDEWNDFLPIENQIDQLKTELNLLEESHTIVIDTNIFIEEPYVIEEIGGGEIIALSAKVIDELDNLKSKGRVRVQAQDAIRNINRHLKDKNVRTMKSDTSKLPADFDRRSADNMILSVAYMYKNKKPIL